MTTEYSAHVCKDCRRDVALYATWLQANHMPGEEAPTPPPRGVRKAPHPGPRCYSHWKARQKEVKAANHEKRVQQTYGLKKGEYAQLYSFQGGLCALCRRATGASRRLSVDHDHATGDVRGLLCRPCNSLLGHSRDRTDYFSRCIEYLNLPPYARMTQGAPFHE
jgi:hypothetical protein